MYTLLHRYKLKILAKVLQKNLLFYQISQNLRFLKLKFIVFLTDFDEMFSGVHQIFRNLQNFIETAILE